MTDTERRIITSLDGLHMALIDTNKVLRDLINPQDGRIHGISNMIVMVQEALGPLLEQLPQYQPSQPTKEATAATGEVNSGTPEFKAGDRVALKRYSGSNHGVITSLNTDGTCALTMDSGHVEYAHVTELERGQNWAAPEFASHSVGDRVEFRAYATPHFDQILRGVIRTIGSDGTALIDSEGGVYCRDLCVLKNLSRP